jgi:hypothetical protein
VKMTVVRDVTSCSVVGSANIQRICCLKLQDRRCGQQAPLKRRCLSIKIHGVTCQMTQASNSRMHNGRYIAFLAKYNIKVDLRKVDCADVNSIVLYQCTVQCLFCVSNSEHL